MNRSDNAPTEPSPVPNKSKAAAGSPMATASQPFGESQLFLGYCYSDIDSECNQLKHLGVLWKVP